MTEIGTWARRVALALNGALALSGALAATFGAGRAEDPADAVFLEPFPDVLAAAGVAPDVASPAAEADLSLAYYPNWRPADAPPELTAPAAPAAAAAAAEFVAAANPRSPVFMSDQAGPAAPTWTGGIDEALDDGAADLSWTAYDSAQPSPVLATLVVEPGDTLTGILTEVGIGYSEANRAINKVVAVWDPRELRPGRQIALSFIPAADEDGAAKLISMDLEVSYDQSVRVRRVNDGAFVADDRTIEFATMRVRRTGIIETSLFVDGAAAGVPFGVLAAMARPLSFDIDFQRTIQPGDAFEVFYEQEIDERGDVVANGDILYASMTLSGELLEIYRFEDQNGIADYFTPEGESIRKALLRTPVDATRISSNFGMRRHPISGYTRMHTGTDFAAPAGTPIYASGDGTVEMAGRNGGYGLYVQIRHNSEFQSAYGHMSRLASGIVPGARVEQGEVIGYVGSTGNSTGPHLHYEIIQNGQKVNPLSVDLPSGEPLEGDLLAQFQAHRHAIDALRLATSTGYRQIATAR